MSEFSLPDYAARHQKLALPVVNAGGADFVQGVGMIHFESDQEISEMMVELSAVTRGTFKMALFTFTEGESALQYIPFEEAKALKLRNDAEQLGMQAFWLDGRTYHAGIWVQL